MMVVNTIALDDCSFINVNEKEALRYLGMKAPDEETIKLLKECEAELYKLSEPRAVYTEASVSVENDTVDLEFMKVKSKNLAKNLEGCHKAYIFCATLGIGLDRHFERLSKISQAKATVFSAAASSLIEGFCDYVNERLAKGECAVPRFSCGYGDFSIEHQSDILNVLQAGKRLGVALTDSYMMVPVKTVTAIIGIRR